MKILIDMNLSPLWVPVLTRAGFDVIHWSTIGKPDAPDSELMAWAKDGRYVVLTHDLDFGDILAATQANGPSVIQVRTQNIHPDHAATLIIHALKQFQEKLETGALIVVDPVKTRARILPINPPAL
jgi:predicted nuclease of predicted toxin-antitoxin system